MYSNSPPLAKSSPQPLTIIDKGPLPNKFLVSSFWRINYFGGHDAMKGSWKKKNWKFDRVWHDINIFQRQFKNTFFQAGLNEIDWPCQRKIFKAKILIEVSKQLQNVSIIKSNKILSCIIVSYSYTWEMIQQTQYSRLPTSVFYLFIYLLPLFLYSTIENTYCL